MGRIDVHSHLLPGVDDGCKNVEESIACARMLVNAGYSHCICTPHIWPKDLRQTHATVRLWTEQLQNALSGANVPLKVVAGSELNLNPDVMQTPKDRIITAALAGKYILVDMWADQMPVWFATTIRWLQAMNLTVILAHPERMRAVQNEPEIADYFAELGILLQGNLQCFADRVGADTRRVAEKYIVEGKYFLLGSDTHGVEGLKTRLVGLCNAIEIAGEEIVDRLTRENPRQLINDTFPADERGR
jgi:protein-tyrosine phosphatase